LEKFKDFIYDKNDIVIALVIVFIAGFIILGRVDAIMNYPETLMEQAQQTTDTVTDSAIASGGAVTTDPSIGTATGTAIVTGSATGTQTPPAPVVTTPTKPTQPAEIVYIYVTIPPGATGDSIAGILITAGFITEKSQFLNAVAAAGADKRLKAGTFKIPNDSNPTQVVNILAN
jgi:hypothetical protein